MLGFWEVTAQALGDGVAQVAAIERLGKDLQRKHVVVLVDDEAGQQVRLAEDDAIGIGVVGDLLAEFDGRVDSLGDQRRQLGLADLVGRDHPNRDLRRAAVERRAQLASALVDDVHQSSRRRIASLRQIRAIDPHVSGAQASGAARGDGDSRGRRS